MLGDAYRPPRRRVPRLCLALPRLGGAACPSRGAAPRRRHRVDTRHLTDRGPVWTAPAAHVAFVATASSGVTSSTVSAIDTSTSRPPTVRAGSFCRVPGSTAQNRRGDTMVCSPASDGRPRWRRALELARQRVTANSSNQVRESGSVSELRLATSSAFAPFKIRFTGTSSFLPDNVRGITGTACAASGT